MLCVPEVEWENPFFWVHVILFVDDVHFFVYLAKIVLDDLLISIFFKCCALAVLKRINLCQKGFKVIPNILFNPPSKGFLIFHTKSFQFNLISRN